MILSISIIIPACVSFLELNCDVSLVIDLDEEVEDIEVIQDAEVKIIPESIVFFSYTQTTNQNKIVFITKKYNSIFQNLESPPPDLLS